jgi:hypothetical protein
LKLKKKCPVFDLKFPPVLKMGGRRRRKFR